MVNYSQNRMGVNKEAMKQSTFIFLIIILLSTFSDASAQKRKVEFVVAASSTEVMLGDYFNVTYTLKNTDGKKFKPPSFTGFDVQGPSMGQKQYNINGRITYEQNYIYNLIPKRVGTFTIPPATIRANGKTLKTKSLTVKVVKRRTQNINADADVLLVAETSVKEAYIGQSVRLDYTIYTAIDIETYKIMNRPDIKGAFAKDIQNIDTPTQERKINGKTYATKVLYRMILYPQQEGKIEINPITMRIAIAKSFFDHDVKSIYSNDLTLDVKPLPDGIPDNFSGAVGSFNMVSTLNTNRVTTDETIVYNLEVTGKGDVKRITPPNLNLPVDSFTVYDPRTDESVVEESGELVYTKTFEYLISPKHAGKLIMEPTFSYYDVDTKKYETLKVTEQPITILKGVNPHSETKPIDENLSGEIRYIKMEGNLHNRSYFYGSIGFWLLLALPFLALGGLLFYKRQQDKINAIDPILKKRKKANRIALKRLEQAKVHLDANESRAFYDEISKTLWGYVSDKLNIPASELSKYTIKDQLQAKNVAEAQTEQFVKALETCEMALFAGMDNAASMQQTYEYTTELMTDLEEQIVNN
jgi:hypothetical protein